LLSYCLSCPVQESPSPDSRWVGRCGARSAERDNRGRVSAPRRCETPPAMQVMIRGLGSSPYTSLCVSSTAHPPPSDLYRATYVRAVDYHLTLFNGDGKSFSEPSNRYLRFVDPGLNLGKALLHSWVFMRAEVGDAPGSIFEAPAKDAPPPIPSTAIRGPMTNRGCSASARALEARAAGESQDRDGPY